LTVKINAHCNLDQFPIQLSRLTGFSRRLLKRCGAEQYNLNILLVDDQEIRQFNKEYRNRDEATNVLSFPFCEGADASIKGLPVYELGDIVISLDSALRESIKYGLTFYQRLSWLVVHGTLHLLGYDHERSEKAADEMFAKEKELLTRLNQTRRRKMAKLAINVDHIATIREARGIMEPDPVTAAAICELAGASGIVIHLREDRRHIQDRDVYLLRETIKTKMNLEMGANKEIIKIALDVQPDLVTLVPEKRAELTTEGGLDVLSQKKKIAKVVEKMNKENIPVSIFVDPDPEQLIAAKEVGATFVELHTGRYCDAQSEKEQLREFEFIAAAAEEAQNLGLRINAGHGLNYQNTSAIAALETIEELSIGHAIIAHAFFVGLDQAVKEMLALVNQAEYC
jgi:pyridoxine 5-phosphate synthase